MLTVLVVTSPVQVMNAGPFIFIANIEGRILFVVGNMEQFSGGMSARSTCHGTNIENFCRSV